MSGGFMSKQGFNTKAIHAGHSDFHPDSMSAPIYQSVAYPFLDAKEAAAISSGKKPGFTYGRWDNPTVNLFETRMAALENTDAAIAAASGMSAIFLLTHHLIGPGENVVSSNRVYGGTFGLFNVGLPKMGASVNWVTKPESIAAWEKAIDSKTKFLFVETPSNPALFIADIPALAALAKKKKLPLVVDNTICTPALQQPVLLGADIVVHSTTKYICGNATSLGGIICGSKKLIDGIRQNDIRYLGPAMAPMNAWLSLNGLETLALRMERHCENAMAVAKFLEKHPKVNFVNYPGLTSSPEYARAKKYLPKGAGAILGFGIKGGLEAGKKFIDSLELISHLANVGDAKTLAIHPATTTHQQLSPEEQLATGVTPDFIRLSIGIEHVDDIIADIKQALAKAAK